MLHKIFPIKRILGVLFFFLFCGFAFSQTTVTLQDQCNCEVLSGTAVTSAGAATPTGADMGDIYVNTTSGTIFFWDGDSWELTASDDQQLTGFTFNDTTNILTLDLENGGNVSIDLSDLQDTLSDTNTTIASFAIDGTNTNLVITDSDTNTFSIALADLAAIIDTNTDNQTLSLTGTDLSIADGNTVDISTIDTDDQTLSLSGTDLSIADGNTVDISSIDTDTDDQTLTLTGNTLSIADGNSVDLSGFVDTDDQTLSLTGTDLSIADGNTVDISTIDTDDQTLSLSGTDLSIADGNTVDISSIDTDTDDQTLTLTGNTLSIADGNSVELSGFVDTDDQTLSLTGTDLSIAEGNTIEISSIDTDTDDQTLSLSGTDLSIADGNTIDISSIDTDTDDQTLTLTGNTLSIADGNSVDFSGFVNTDAQDLSISGNDLSLSGDPTATPIDLSSYVNNDINELQTISKSGSTVTLSNGGGSFTDSDTTYSAGTGLTLSGTTFSVDASSVNTDDQTADEVALITARIDLDGDGSTTPADDIDVDGDGVVETEVQGVVEAIAPITSKAARIFYPPSIALDASSNGTFTIDLYQEYISQYGSPVVSSDPTNAPTIPLYNRNELYYYVTYADPTVFGNGTTVQNMSIDGSGLTEGTLNYQIFNQPADYNALINVVFVVK
ncbi:MAG: beta strand repeat-containing protein [Croceivirga sp.]